MKICALTMVYQDHWAIGQWYRHYGASIGHRNLFIISHGNDPELPQICPEASIINIPRDDMRNFDRVRARLMNDIQSGLANVYDWIIQTDADELICLDPDRFTSFEDLLGQVQAPALFALGLNLAEIDGDVPLHAGMSALAHRNIAAVTGTYSKAWAVQKALPLRWHGVFCGHKKTDEFPYEMPDGVFLVHLKYANTNALKLANDVRKSVANSVGNKWNVPGWAKPDYHAKRFYRKLAKAPELPWQEAVAYGHEQIRDQPVRDPKRGIVKSPFINYVCRTILPDWFRQY